MQRELHIPQTCITDIFYYSSSTAEGSKVKKVRPGSRMSSKVHSLEIRCKDFRVVRFGLKFTPKKDHVKMVNAIAHYKTPSSIVLLFAFPYSMVQNCSDDGSKGRLNTIPTFRTLPDWLNELSRLQVDDTWRVATVNSNFQTCPSLSEMFVVLASLSDSDINRMSLHYIDSRLPTWCWSDPKTGIPMLCSGAGRLVLLKPHVACSIYSVTSKLLVRTCTVEPLISRHSVMFSATAPTNTTFLTSFKQTFFLAQGCPLTGGSTVNVSKVQTSPFPTERQI